MTTPRHLGISAILTSLVFLGCSDDTSSGDDEVGETGMDTGTDTGDETTSDTDTTTSDTDTTTSDTDTTTTSDTDTTTTSDTDTTTTSDTDTTTSDTDTTTSDTGTDTTDTGTDTGGDMPGGQVRVMHGSPDAPPVDVYIEGLPDPVISGLAYGQTSGFLPVPEGEYNFQVYVAGTDPIPENLVIETGLVMIDLDVDYTVLARGLLGAEMGEGEFGLDLYVEAFEPVAPDTVRARIVHAGADAPTVDLDVYDANAEAPCGPEREIVDFARFTETGAAGVELPAIDGLNVAVCAGDVTARTFTLDLAALSGAELFVFADGLLAQDVGRAPDAFLLFAIGPDTVGDALAIRRDPLFYLLHAVPDVGNVNLCLEGSLAAGIADVAFGDLAGEFSLPPNRVLDYAIDPVGGGPPCGEQIPFPIDGASLTRGDTHIVTVAGSVGLDNLSQEIYTEGFALDDVDNVRVRAVHMSPDTPEVDIGAEGAGFGLFTDLAYPNASDPAGASVPPGVYTIQAGVSMGVGEDADTAAVSFGPVDLQAAAGARAFGFVGGLLAPQNLMDEPLVLMLVTTSAQGDYGWTINLVPAN